MTTAADHHSMSAAEFGELERARVRMREAEAALQSFFNRHPGTTAWYGNHDSERRRLHKAIRDAANAQHRGVTRVRR